MIRWVRFTLFTTISLLALVATVRLVAPADTTSSVRRQLVFLRHELAAGAAERAQRDFPEGYFFLYALYGLTQVDLGSAGEARWALSRIDSPAGREPFSASLAPEYGVFYRGWLNWLRGGILSLRPPAERDPAEVSRFERDSAEIAAAFDASPTPFLAAYPGQAWPVDSTVAIASLRLHDKLMTARYGPTVARWTTGVLARLDPATGLIPHTADVGTGSPSSGARGTSQSVIQRFLVDIDPQLARTQYQAFRRSFLSRPLGLGPAIREYPHGISGPADVDSGPLPLGISLSATVVTLGAAKVHSDTSLARALGNLTEVAGMPLDTIHSRRYILGALPIGDAFLAWSKSARPLVAPPQPPMAPAVSQWWRSPLLALLALVGLAPWLSLSAYRRWRPARRPGHGQATQLGFDRTRTT